jgi:prepilin-type N-terminal cleavage/methylation domain-containing protein
MTNSRDRRGFTLAEMLIVMLIMGFLGLGFVRLIVAQTRFFQHELGKKNARNVSRSGMNLMVSDLRMVQDSGGVDSVSADARTVRVFAPFAYGLVCNASASPVVASLLPVDSTSMSLSSYGGWAWRDSTGRYRIVTPSFPLAADSVHTAGSALTCTGGGVGQAGIRTMTLSGRTGRVISITPYVSPSPTPGTPMFLWQKITYSFGPSTAFPGLYGLFRKPGAGTSEEILAPFDTSSRFRFYVPGQDTSQATIPSLSKIRGFDVLLNGVSPTLAPGQTRTITKMVTAVFFKNTRTF